MLTQQRTSGRQIFPSPADGALVEETPPVFSFLKERGEAIYTVIVQNEAGEPVYSGETTRNYLVPGQILPPGRYRWNLRCGGEERGWWNFTISEQAVSLPRPTADEVWEKVPTVRPRHLFFAEDLEAIRRDRAAELDTLRRNIALALSRPLPEPPCFHCDPQKPTYREYFGAYRDYCDRDLVACALGWAILGDEAAAQKAKALLLTICSWNPAGPCSLNAPWYDEVGLSNARCLPAVYDLLCGILNEEERYLAEQTILAYAAQCEERLQKLDFTQNPGDSHAGRIPAYMGEAALVLKGSPYASEDLLKRWLRLALEIYGGIFPFFGCEDGGWAEGPFYASSYTRWYLPFFLAVERFSGFQLLDRPFYQRVSQFFLHFALPCRENHPFCDGYWCGSEDPEWPGFFAQNPFRIYGERFGPAPAREWAKKCAAPEIFKLHLLDVFLPAGDPPAAHLTGEAENLAVFPKAGFASCQTNPADQAQNTALLIRASRYGAVSHQHADQGSFALIRNNVTLISPSGYFGWKWGTNHHRLWTRTTRAHNCILVDGTGQEDGGFRAAGRFTGWERQADGCFRIEADLTAAYPMLSRCRRTWLLDEKKLVVEDEILAEEPHEISWLLHSLSEPERMPDGSVRIARKGEAVRILPDPAFCGEAGISGEFGVDLNDGVEEKVRVSMPQQFHITFRTEKQKTHRIRVIFELEN